MDACLQLSMVLSERFMYLDRLSTFIHAPYFPLFSPFSMPKHGKFYVVLFCVTGIIIMMLCFCAELEIVHWQTDSHDGKGKFVFFGLLRKWG